MNFWRWMAGEVRVQLTSADLEGAMQTILAAGLTLQDTAQVDGLTISFRLPAGQLPGLEKIAARKGWELSVLERRGLKRVLERCLTRPVLVLGLALILGASVYLPSRVLFVRVEGNTTVPSQLILEQAAQCGIGFGASRQAVRSQKMKDALLEAMPQLQWAGVNTAGCVAIITVQERGEEPKPEGHNVSSIVAVRDGIITQINATQGTAKFTVGQAVRAGDVLISGYTDCGFCIRAQQAKGEIFAQTDRELTALTPSHWQMEGEKQTSEKKYALILGKNRINFYKGSGNPGGVCDKIYSEYYITLPGGFALPVCIVTEVWTYGETEAASLPEELCMTLLTDFSAGYLRQQMTAGTVTERQEQITAGEGVYRLTGNYACIEMIGRQRIEESIKPDE